MRKIFQILLLTFIISSVYGQTEKESFWKPYLEKDIAKLKLQSLDSFKYERVYRIWDNHSVVELIKNNDSTYYGQLVNFVTKISNETDAENEMGTIYKKIPLSKENAKKLIEYFSNENIETLRDSYEIEGYPNGLDGTTIIFELGYNNMKRIYSYWEPEDDYYKKPNIKDVINVRNILKALKSEIDFKKTFDSFLDSLDIGMYDLGGIILTKK